MSAANDPQPHPSPDDLDRVAVTAVVRRAPRLARVIVTGALVGVVFGAVIAAMLPGGGYLYRGTTGVLLGLSFAFLGALVAGAIATRPGAGSNPARVGVAVGIVLAVGIIMLTRPASGYSRLWVGVSVLLIVGIPYFTRMFFKSFEEPVDAPATVSVATFPPAAPEASREALPNPFERAVAESVATAKKPAAKKPTTVAKKPAASSRTPKAK